MLLELLVISISLLYLFWYRFVRYEWPNCPPGPRRLPFLGNLLDLATPAQHLTMSKWANEYGPIMRADMATSRSVVISDHKLVKEAFSEPAFAGRMDFSGIFDPVGDGKMHGLVGSEGAHWEELRRFSLRQLRDFGFGKSSMEDSIIGEVEEFVRLIKKHGDDKAVKDVRERFNLAVVNALWFIMTGKRQKQDDPALFDMIDKFTRASEGLIKSPVFAAMLFAPKMAPKIFPSLSGLARFRKAYKEFTDYFSVSIEEHKRTWNEDYDRDFTDVFIREMKAAKDPNSPFFGEEGEKSILCVLADLYLAGSDSTSTTLTWLVLYLAKMPYIQKRFQEEIAAVSGNSRAISISDRARMPYTEALISEVHRYASITALPHKALKDHVFHGYLIPKGVNVTANVHHIHHDPKVWGDPWNFRPERFLSPDGTEYRRNEALIPFSVGRRQCIGENLARDTLFLFATNLFQRFNIEFDPEGPDHGLEAKTGFVLMPKDYQVYFRDRQI